MTDLYNTYVYINNWTCNEGLKLTYSANCRNLCSNRPNIKFFQLCLPFKRESYKLKLFKLNFIGM